MQKVSDVRAHLNENIRHAAKIIGRSAVRRDLFEAIYYGKQKVKTVDELAEATGLSRKHVLSEGKKLADNGVVGQVKVKGRTAYEKYDTFVQHKAAVLKLVKDPSKRKDYPTQQEPRVQAPAVVRIKIAASRSLPEKVTVDDVASFAAVKEHSAPPPGLKVNELPEKRVNWFLRKVIGEPNDFTDWGGEKYDFHTNRLLFNGKRRTAAFALKGRATRGTLTPGKMGRNGDQIGRLFTSEAQLFFVVYHSKIDEAVVQQMEAFAVGRAAGGARVYYGWIDGDDLGRLIAAYPAEFAASAEA